MYRSLLRRKICSGPPPSNVILVRGCVDHQDAVHGLQLYLQPDSHKIGSTHRLCYIISILDPYHLHKWDHTQHADTTNANRISPVSGIPTGLRRVYKGNGAVLTQGQAVGGGAV